MDEKVYQEILEQMAEGVYFVDLDRKITFWNRGAEQISGYSADEVIGHSCAEGILRHVNEHGTQLCVHGCPLAAVMKDGQPREAAVYLHHKSGHRVPVTVSGHAITNQSGGIVGSVELFHPRAATIFAARADEDIKDDPHMDPLTGIGNRRFGELNLDPLVAAVNDGITSLGVLFIDVDHFKKVNDTFGHLTGDRVLRMVGQNLANALTNTDFPLRWGGEEFLCLIPGATEERLEQMAQRARILVEHSWLQKDDVQVRVTVSVGATLAEPGESPTEVIDRADRLMYLSKSSGRNQVHSDSGALPRTGEVPLLGTTAPWEMAEVNVERSASTN